MKAGFARVLLAAGAISALIVHAGGVGVSSAQELSPSISFRHASVPLDAGLVSVAVGDVTGDGRNEVLATSGDGNDDLSSSLFMVTVADDGSLRAPVQYRLSGHEVCCNARQMGIAVGDVTGDGHNEVVVATARGLDVFAWDGVGLARSLHLEVSGVPQHVRIADMDGDGRADIVLRAGSTSEVDGGVFILANTPSGFTERRAVTFPHHWQGALEVTGLNDDGRPDIILAANEVLIGLQQDDGSFAVASYEPHRFPVGIAAADLTGDGAVDVAVGSSGNVPTFVEVFGNDGAGRLGTPVQLDSFQLPTATNAADLNGSGRADLVVMHSGGYNAVGTYVQRDDGLAEEHLFRLPQDNASHHWNDSMTVGDVDGDRRPDVVFVDSIRIVVLFNTTDYEPANTDEDPETPSEAPDGGDAPEDTGEVAVERVEGTTRYDTAAALSQAFFQPGVDRVYLVTGTDFPDALAAGSAAAAHDGPVLLTEPDRLPQPVADELARLDPGEIIIVGGEHVISARVEDDAAAVAPVRRVAGADRYATAATLIADTFDGTGHRVYLASGVDFPDALAGSAAAAYQGAAMLLTAPDQLPLATRQALEALAPRDVIVLGGPAAVSDDVLEQVERVTGAQVGRVAGADRYATAQAISQAVFSDATVAFMATGEHFPDALVAGPAASQIAAPTLLTPTRYLHDAADAELRRLAPDRVILLGGTTALSDQVAQDIRQVHSR